MIDIQKWHIVTAAAALIIPAGIFLNPAPQTSSATPHIDTCGDLVAAIGSGDKEEIMHFVAAEQAEEDSLDKASKDMGAAPLFADGNMENRAASSELVKKQCMMHQKIAFKAAVNTAYAILGSQVDAPNQPQQ